MLEIKFAALRDRLYIERMEEAAAEEEMIHDGTHPALTYLYKTLAGRREKLHEVASRRHQQTLEELVKAREAEKDAEWTWWTVSSSGSWKRRGAAGPILCRSADALKSG
jgi:hypothetical protein